MNSESLETWMAAKVAEALMVDAGQVDRTVSFTSYGLDSVALLTLTGEMAELLGRDLPTTLAWDYPTIELLARHLTEPPEEPDGGIPRVPRDQPIPLSFAQERMWRLARKDEAGDSNMMFPSFIIRGDLNVDALRQSFTELVRRHEILRTTFEVADDQPVQVVHPPSSLDVSFFDLVGKPDPEAEALRLAEEEAAKPMHLDRGPLLRVTLLRLEPSQHLLVISLHHQLFDVSSMRIFYAELNALYAAFRDGVQPALPEVALQLADFAAWQRKRLRRDGPVYREHIAWWRDYFSGPLPPPIKLPFRKRRRAAPPEGTKSFVIWEIPPDLVERIKSLGRQEGATPYSLLFAAFTVLLYHATRQPEFFVHTYVSDRNRHSSKDSLGFFVNVLALRARFNANPTFSEVLTQVRSVVQDASARHELPFEEMTRELESEGCKLPPVQVIFQFQTDSGKSLDLQGVETKKWKPNLGWKGQGFSLTVRERVDSLKTTLSFDPELYEAAGAIEMMGQFGTLLETMVADPLHPIPQPPDPPCEAVSQIENTPPPKPQIGKKKFRFRWWKNQSSKRPP